MARLKKWPSRFAALVAAARLEPFAWGTHDCCLWAAAAVLAITGEDPAHDVRGTYQTERAARRVLVSIGGLEGAGRRCGVPIDAALATQGDVGLVTWPDGVRSLAVCDGLGWLCAGTSGLVVLGRDAATAAWGVGHA